MTNRRGLLSCLIVAAGLLAAACGDSGYDNPTMASGNGRLAVQMTDATTDLVSSVNVYVTGITVKERGRAVARIASDIGLIDVLALKGTTELLVEAGVPAGEYEFVQVDLDQERSNVVLEATGTVLPLKIPSEEIKVLGGFTVREGGTTTVTLDFQADASLQLAIDGHWMLTPVIVMQSATVSG